MERLIRSISVLALAGAVTLVPGCSGEEGPTDPPAVTGIYRVEVTSPNGPEGGALLALPASGVAATERLDGQLHARESGDRIRVLLLRSEPGDLAFLLELDGEGPVPEVELLQVASPDNALRDLAGYGVETTRE